MGCDGITCQKICRWAQLFGLQDLVFQFHWCAFWCLYAWWDQGQIDETLGIRSRIHQTGNIVWWNSPTWGVDSWTKSGVMDICNCSRSHVCLRGCFSLFIYGFCGLLRTVGFLYWDCLSFCWDCCVFLLGLFVFFARTVCVSFFGLFLSLCDVFAVLYHSWWLFEATSDLVNGCFGFGAFEFISTCFVMGEFAILKESAPWLLVQYVY